MPSVKENRQTIGNLTSIKKKTVSTSHVVMGAHLIHAKVQVRRLYHSQCQYKKFLTVTADDQKILLATIKGAFLKFS